MDAHEGQLLERVAHLEQAVSELANDFRESEVVGAQSVKELSSAVMSVILELAPNASSESLDRLIDHQGRLAQLVKAAGEMEKRAAKGDQG